MNFLYEWQLKCLQASISQNKEEAKVKSNQSTALAATRRLADEWTKWERKTADLDAAAALTQKRRPLSRTTASWATLPDAGRTNIFIPFLNCHPQCGIHIVNDQLKKFLFKSSLTESIDKLVQTYSKFRMQVKNQFFGSNQLIMLIVFEDSMTSISWNLPLFRCVLVTKVKGKVYWVCRQLLICEFKCILGLQKVQSWPDLTRLPRRTDPHSKYLRWSAPIELDQLTWMIPDYTHTKGNKLFLHHVTAADHPKG